MHRVVLNALCLVVNRAAGESAMQTRLVQSCTTTPLEKCVMEAIKRNITAGNAEAEVQRQAAKVLSSVAPGILICRKRDRLLTYSNPEGGCRIYWTSNRDHNAHASNREGFPFRAAATPPSRNTCYHEAKKVMQPCNLAYMVCWASGQNYQSVQHTEHHPDLHGGI